MKLSLRWHLQVLLMAWCSLTLNATIFIPGNQTQGALGEPPSSQQTFDSPVNVALLDNITGNFYVGLGFQVDDATIPSTQGTDSAGLGYMLAYAQRLDYCTTATFQPMCASSADQTVFANSSVADMTIATSDYAITATLFFIVNAPGNAAPYSDTNFPSQGVLFAAGLPTGNPKSTTGLNGSNTSTILDATNDENNPNGGIAAIAASADAVYAAVTDTTNTGYTTGGTVVLFGTLNSGIALITLGDAVFGTSADPDTTMAYQSTVLFNNTIAELTGSTSNVTIPATPSPNTPALWWDPFFNQLYVGLSVQQTTNGDKALSVAIIRRDDTSDPKTLTVIPILDNYGAIAATDNNIIVNEARTSTISLTVNTLRVMHTSTGFDYLIVQGGNGASDTCGNTVYALPLYRPDPYDPNNANRGQLANKSDPNTLADGNNANLITNTDVRALVGACATLPMAADGTVGNIQVIGDAVYASISTALTDGTDVGLFMSQAIFDDAGKIQAWTYWQRIAPPNAFQPPVKNSDNEDISQNFGQVSQFAVDPVNGKTWLVSGQVPDPTNENAPQAFQSFRQVKSTTWSKPTNASTLPGALNRALPYGSYSVLDLNQGLVNLGTVTQSRYALFGGMGSVVFARISLYPTGDPQRCGPETVLFDNYLLPDSTIFNPENLLITKLPNDCSAVRALGYTDYPAGEEANYFLAGTDHGLYTFAEDGTPFDANTLNALSFAPFTGGTWTKVEGIDEAVVAIRSVGSSGCLYVLTNDITTKGPPADKVYQINLSDPTYPPVPVLIATSGTLASPSDLRTATTFTGLAALPISDTNPPNPHDPSSQRALLATNNGIYEAKAGIINGQADANWQLAPADSENVSYVNLVPLPVSSPATVWPISIVRNPDCTTLFNRCRLDQIGSNSGELVDISVAFTPEDFDSSNPRAFKTLYPLNGFWTEGGRRFMMGLVPGNPPYVNRLFLLPFETTYWRMPNTMIPLYDPVLNTVQRYYWVQAIGSSGLILAGTNRGVVCLG